MEARGKLRGKTQFVLNHLWTRPQSCGHMSSSPKVISRMELVHSLGISSEFRVREVRRVRVGSLQIPET
jgi:hypothetical protein